MIPSCRRSDAGFLSSLCRHSKQRRIFEPGDPEDRYKTSLSHRSNKEKLLFFFEIFLHTTI